MSEIVKNILRVIFYPIVLLRRQYIKNRNVKWSVKDPKSLANYFYKNSMGHDICWEYPQDLNEKINWLKFRSDTSLWTRLSDKYLVREYVKKKGLANLLTDLYGVWEDAKDIDFSLLPDQFVLKTNHGCGTVILVEDKSELNIAATRDKLNDWLKIRYGLKTAEPHYLGIKPLIIAEQLLKPKWGGVK